MAVLIGDVSHASNLRSAVRCNLPPPCRGGAIRNTNGRRAYYQPRGFRNEFAPSDRRWSDEEASRARALAEPAAQFHRPFARLFYSRT